MNKIELVTAWTATREKDEYVPFHSHNYYELVYYRVGQGGTQIGGTLYEFTANRFALIPPGIEHDENHYVDTEVYCIGFFMQEMLQEHFGSDEVQTIEGIARVIMEETFLQHSGYKDMIEAKLNELVVVLRRLLGGQSQKVQARSFEYVINYLAENSHEKIVLKELAEQLNFSYDYFQHHFKELVGVSPQQFLINRRVEMAKRLLKEGQFSCTEIAYRCGFSNSAQFSYIFKRETGISPKNVLREKTRKPTSSLDTKRQKS